MTPAPTADEADVFTIVHRDHEDQKKPEDSPTPQLASNVNIVKPLQLDDEMDGEHVSPANNMFDPKFSRALDFKLRRLKEKEILQTNLRRPTRYRPKNGALATSNPNVSSNQPPAPGKHLSQSHPRIDNIEPESYKKISPNMLKSPERKTRSRNAPLPNDGDKPRFMTTVKSGQFLLPPPELARILGLETLYPQPEKEKVVYSYSSRPKVVAPRSKRSVIEKKPEPQLSNGNLCNGNGEVQRRRDSSQMFSGVRALIAGVVGMTSMLDKQEQPYVS